MHFRQPEFAYSACFFSLKTKNKKIKETGDSRYIYQNELDKACFQLNMSYGNFKDFPRRTASDRVLCDNAFRNAKNPKYDGYQRDLAPVFYNFFNKKEVYFPCR